MAVRETKRNFLGAVIPCREGSGSSVANTKLSVTGSLFGGATWDSTGGIKFTSVNQYVSFSTNSAMTLTNTQSCTVMGWLKAGTATGGHETYFTWGTSGTRRTFIISRSGTRVLSYWDSTTGWIQSTINIPSNIWVHLAWVIIPGSTAKLYINGKLGYTSAAQGASMAAVNSYLINSATTEYLNGTVRDIRCYTTALSGSEILQHYRATSVVPVTGNIHETYISPIPYVPPVIPYVSTTLAGLYGSEGRVDATGTAARFSEIYHLSINTTNGDIYTGSLDLGAAPYDGHCVRKTTQAGVVTTLMVGQGAPGAQYGVPVDGAVPGTATSGWPFAASYNNITGDLYISDGNGAANSIRRITGGVSSIFAGNYTVSGSTMGTGTAARFYGVRNIVFNSTGTIGYFFDADRHILCAITIPGAVVTTIAGTSGSTGSTDGTGSAARFNNPRGVCMGSDGNIYVADTENSIIRQVTPAGVTITVAGLAGSTGNIDGTGNAARLNRPYAIVEGAPGIFYIQSGLFIRRMAMSGGVGTITTVMGTGTAGNGEGSGLTANIAPLGLTYYNNTLYIGNGGQSILKVINVS
jgi:hypothetical protein